MNQFSYLWLRISEVVFEGNTCKTSDSGSVKSTGLEPELLTRFELSSSGSIGDVILVSAYVFCVLQNLGCQKKFRCLLPCQSWLSSCSVLSQSELTSADKRKFFIAISKLLNFAFGCLSVSFLKVRATTVLICLLVVTFSCFVMFFVFEVFDVFRTKKYFRQAFWLKFKETKRNQDI